MLGKWKEGASLMLSRKANGGTRRAIQTTCSDSKIHKIEEAIEKNNTSEMDLHLFRLGASTRDKNLLMEFRNVTAQDIYNDNEPMTPWGHYSPDIFYWKGQSSDTAYYGQRLRNFVMGGRSRH